MPAGMNLSKPCAPNQQHEFIATGKRNRAGESCGESGYENKKRAHTDPQLSTEQVRSARWAGQPSLDRVSCSIHYEPK